MAMSVLSVELYLECDDRNRTKKCPPYRLGSQSLAGLLDEVEV